MSFFFLSLFIIITFLRPQEWVPGMVGLPILDGIVALTTVSLLLDKFGAKESFLLPIPQNPLVFLFFIAIIMSHIVHTYLYGLTKSFSAFFPVLMFFFLTLNGTDTLKKFKTAFWLIVILNLILVKQGHDQVQQLYGWAGQRIVEQQGAFRITWVGIFGDPNDLALSFVIALGFLLPFVFAKNFATRLASLFSMCVLMYGVYLTNSRGGVLAVLATLFVFFVRKTKSTILGGVIGGIGALVFLVFAPSRMSELSSDEGSASSRLDLWYGGLQIFKSNPIFGRGHNMYMDTMPQTAHNSFVLAMAELGMFGLIVWVALLFVSFKWCWVIQERDKELEPYAMALQSSIVGFAAAAFFLSRTYNMLPFLLAALAGSLMYIYGQKDSSINYALNKNDWMASFAISIISIFAVYMFIRVR